MSCSHASVLRLVSCLAFVAILIKPAAASPVVPDFDPADFVAGASIDNPYFPVKPGIVFTYGAQVNNEDEKAANPQAGFECYQQFSAAAKALDQAKIVSLNEHLTLPIESLSDVVKTDESTVLEPGLTENRLYTKSIRQSLSLTLDDIDATANPQNTIPLQTVAAVPLPPAALTGITTLIAVLIGITIFTHRHHGSH
jgi:hypothetical protein